MATVASPRPYVPHGDRFEAEPLRTLVEKRLDQGWTIGNISIAAGVPERRIWGLLNREFRGVALSTTDRICCALNIHIGDLYPEYWR